MQTACEDALELARIGAIAIPGDGGDVESAIERAQDAQRADRAAGVRGEGNARQKAENARPAVRSSCDRALHAALRESRLAAQW